MGFRSTVISEEFLSSALPDWLFEKHKNLKSTGRVVYSPNSFKIYDNEIWEDIQKALIESGKFEKYPYSVAFIVLHEDDVATRVMIGEKSISYDYSFFNENPSSEGVWRSELG